MVSAYHNYVLPYYEKKKEGMQMWAEALLRRAMLKEQMGWVKLTNFIAKNFSFLHRDD